MTMLVIIMQFFVSSLLFHPGQGIVKGESAAPQQTLALLPIVAVRPIVRPPDPTTAPETTAAAAAVWDATTHTFLYAKELDTVRPLASVTKLMTALLVLEAATDLDRTVTIQSGDNDPEGSRLHIATGAIVSVRDLFYATLVESANNSAEALVRAAGIDEGEFVRRMNVRAADLGMAHTHYTDVTGLGPQNVSTAHDLVLLAQEAFAEPLIREATTMQKYEVHDQASGKVIAISNTDILLGKDLQIVAGKTGWAGFSGGNLMAEFTDTQGHDLVSIVLGSAGTNERFSDTAALVRWAFTNTHWSMP